MQQTKKIGNKLEKNNKVIEPHPSFQLPSNNFYLSERGGVKILYESEESDEGIQSFFQESEPVNIKENLIAVAADLHPYNLMSADTNIQKAGKSGNGVPENPHSPIKTSENNQEIKSNNFIGESSKVQEESRYDNTKVSETKSYLTDNQIPQPPPEPNNLNKSSQELLSAEVIEEYEDEQFDYEYDDDLVEDTLEPDPTTFPLPNVETDDQNLILISEDPPFTEQDLEEFINNELAEPDQIPITSEGSFHSLQQSLLSTSSFVMELGKLGVEHAETSNSHSSKRKEVDGVEDTASSSKIGKKRKN